MFLKKMNSLFKASLLLCLSLLLSACASQQVDLIYSTEGASMGAINSPELQVMELQNRLAEPYIGINSSGEHFEARTSPTAWVTRALTDELVKIGVRANYGGAVSGNAKSIKGSLDRLWLEQTGTGQYKIRISITIEMPSSANTFLNQTFNAEQSSLMMPSDKNFSDLFESTLRDAVVPAAAAVKGRLQ